MRHSRSIFIWLAIAALWLCFPGLAAAHARSPRGHSREKSGKAKPAGDPVSAGLRDPFAPLLSAGKKPGRLVVRPPGKAGLMIGEIDVQGTVRGPHGAVAVVSSPDGHVYFLRPGDRLFDGRVEKIDLNSVVFIERARDAFGRPFERRVMKAVQSPQGAKR